MTGKSEGKEEAQTPDDGARPSELRRHSSRADAGGAQYELMMDTIGAGIHGVDLDGRIMFENPASANMFGFEVDELIGRLAHETIHHSHRDGSHYPKEKCPIYATMRDGEVRRVRDSVFWRRDGTSFPVDYIASPTRNAEGEIIGVTVAFFDITERKRVANRLEQRTFDLGERVKELGCLYDISRILLGAKSHQLGEVAERLVDVIPSGWQYPDIARARVRLGDVVRQSSDFEITPWVQRRSFGAPDGIDGEIEVVYLENPGQQDEGVFLDEEGRLLDAIANRLSEAARRFQAEQQVRFQATLLDAVGEAVMAIDLEGQVLYWNKSAERLYGWSAEEAIGQNALELVLADDARERADEVMAQMQRGESWSGEFVVQIRDGSALPVHVTNSPIYDGEGELIGVVGISRDLSARKEIEAQLRQAQKLEAVGRLAGGIAHDFNNMLTAIQGNAQILLLDVTDDDELLESVREIDRAARRAASLTRQLLAFSRQQVLEPRVVALDDIVADIEPMLQRLLGERVELSVHSEDDLGHVEADPGQLTQVVMNLAVNARDAMPGGGRISIELQNAQTDEGDEHTLGEAASGRYVLMSVSDDGVGMDEETVSNIFEPFFTTKDDGSGLGLATVYGIISQSGGHIQVDTEPGQGTTFYVYLPRVDPPGLAPASDVEPVNEEVSEEARTVLVCEDEPAVRRLARRALERQGYRVLEVSCGLEALELLEHTDERIDLLLSDVVMPRLGGVELARKLAERWPHIEVLLMSGYPSRDVLDEEVLAVDLPFLQKPFSFEDLAEKVRDVLGEDGRSG